MNERIFNNSIAIDSKGTKNYGQTYSYHGLDVWVHIVSLMDRFDPYSDLVSNIELFLRKEKKNLFSENKPEKCISVNISNGLICCSQVYLTKKITFEEADEILLFENSTEAYLNEWIRIFYKAAKSLKGNQFSLEKFSKKPLMSKVIGELSIFVSAKFGEYMFQNDLHGVNKIYLYVNPFEFSSQDEKTVLTNLFRDASSTSAFYSDFIKKRLFTLKSKNLLEIELQEPNIHRIELFKAAFLYLKKVSINLDFEAIDKKIQLIKEIYFLFNKKIFPQFNYFAFWIDKYRSKRARYQLMTRKEAENTYNFDTNYEYYSKISEVFKDPWNFIYIYLIYKSLSPSVNRIENFVQRVNNEKFESKKMNQSLFDTRKKQKTQAGQFFSESLSFYSVVVEYFSDINNDFIMRLKFPTVKSFFQIPVNPALNFSKLFTKWKPKIDEQSINLSLLVHFTNNLSTDNIKKTQTISAESWKESIDLKDFQLFYNLDFLESNEHLFDRLKHFNEETTKNEDTFTLNTDLTLNYTFDSISSGQVLVVQANIDTKFSNELNTFVNEDYDNYRRENEDAVDPSSKPHIELLKFNKLIHYCFVHHSKAKSQDFIWMISNVKIEKLNGLRRFKTTLKVTEFTEKFWLNSFDKKPSNICLSFKNLVENNLFDIDRLVYADDEYVNIFHGVIIDFDEMIQYYLNNKEVKELELILEFDKDSNLPIDKLVSLEIYSDDLLEEQKIKKQKEEQEYKERIRKADKQAEIQRKRDREIEEKMNIKNLKFQNFSINKK